MRIVIKIGTSTLAHPTGLLNIRRVEEICKVISDIKNAGNQIMKELLISIVSGLVEEPEKITVEVDEANEEGVVVYHLKVAEGDVGRVIGKQGRIAKAIRQIMKAAANTCNKHVTVEIK